MSEEIFLDLDTNQELEGDYFNCNVRLIDSIFALMESGYEVIDCKMSDPDNIYLKGQDISVDTRNSQVNANDIIQEGKNKDEYRRITYKDSERIRYDSFSPDDYIEIKILGKHTFPNVPEGYRVISFDDCTVLKIKIKTEYVGSIYDNHKKLKKLDISSTISELNSWISSITGKEVEQKSFINTKYGNSEMAIDYKKKKIIEGNYVLIDSLMVPIIVELRQKGYQTLGCCSGHHDRVFIQNTGLIPEEEHLYNETGPWIVFSSKSPVPDHPPVGAKWRKDSEHFRVAYSHSVLNDDGTYKPVSVIKNEIEISIKKLLEWAKSLPYANQKKHSK